METVEEMWARIDAEYKSRYDKIVRTKVESSSDAYNFIKLLNEMTSLWIYIDENKKWEDVFDRYIFLGNFAHNSVFGRYNDMAKDLIIERLKVCDALIGRKFVAMAMHDYKWEQELKKPIVELMSGEEEARECNRQFKCMMDEADAWSNID